MGFDFKIASLTAQNTFTDYITPYWSNSQNGGFLDFSVTGTWAGTITVQKRYYREGAYTDPIDLPDTYTENTAQMIEDHVKKVEYRAGFKTGEYTSGTAAVRIER